MKIARLVGATLVAILAISAVVAGTASAAGPTFKSTFPNHFTGKSATSVLADATVTVTCTADSNVGEITGASKAAKVVVKFTGCKGKEGTKESCAAKSAGAGAEEIVTRTLDGELGSVKTTQAATGVGLLLLPETTKKFVTIEGTCIPTAAVEGSIAGEASPVAAAAQTTGKLTFSASTTSQSIKEITVLGAEVEPELTFGGTKATESTTDELTFENTLSIS